MKTKTKASRRETEGEAIPLVREGCKWGWRKGEYKLVDDVYVCVCVCSAGL
jgi:hypothetical protein